MHFNAIPEKDAATGNTQKLSIDIVCNQLAMYLHAAKTMKITGRV